jgi:hypothetical protein
MWGTLLLVLLITTLFQQVMLLRLPLLFRQHQKVSKQAMLVVR